MKKFLFAFLVLFLCYVIFFNFNDTIYYITVDNIEKDIMSIDCSNDNFDLKKTIVYATDKYGKCRILKNSKNYLRGKTDISKIDNVLEIGKKYKVKVIGVYFDFLGIYQNIVKIEEVLDD